MNHEISGGSREKHLMETRQVVVTKMCRLCFDLLRTRQKIHAAISAERAAHSRRFDAVPFACRRKNKAEQAQCLGLQYSMNFLAHAYLSFGHDEILAGNMVSDFIKGKSRFDYPEGIQKGISLHRSIDAFTDNHAATRRAMQLFRPGYRLYSGAIMDVLYDHFLACDEKIFPGASLSGFSLAVYQSLEQQAHLLPSQFRHMFFYMKTENWLLHYKERAGIQKSLRGLVRRAAYLTESETAFRVFEEHYDFLEQCYGEFIADVKEYAKQQFELLINKPTG